MGVPFVERGGGGGGGGGKIGGKKVRGVWLLGSIRSNRFKDLYRRKVSVSRKSIESRALDVPAPRVFSQTCSILWIVYAIHLTGVFATFDKTGDIKVEIKVPYEAKLGSTVELNCEWQLYGASGLYSVKWYKDDHEFFRYVPEDNPRIQTFSQPGINIDNVWNKEKSIRLKDLEASSSGQYKCEVSTEAPSFATIYRTANLTVIALPERGPEITGLRSRYTLGDDVTANCTVWPSIPKAVIRWSVNGKPIAIKKTIQYSRMEAAKKEEKEEKEEKEKEKKEKGEKKFSTATTPNVAGLRLKLEASHFEDIEETSSAVRIKCIAEIGSNVIETERRVPMEYDSHRSAYANKQRLSGEDTRSKGNGPHRVHSGQRFSLLLLCYFCSRLRTNEQIYE